MTGRTGIHHGTYGGYQQERRRGLGICDECRAAVNEYRRHHRKQSPRVYERERLVIDARRRALLRLAKLHPEDMQHLYDDELRKAGLK